MGVHMFLLKLFAATGMALLQTSVSADGSTEYGDKVISLHGVGSASPCLRSILQMIEDQCEYPCRLTFRFSEENAQDLFSGQNSRTNEPKYAFGASHTPLSSEKYDILNSTKMNSTTDETVKVYHFPYSMTALGLMTNLVFEVDDPSYTPPSLNLTSDLIAKMFLGKITKWTDEDILRQNPILQTYAPFSNQSKSISIGYLLDPGNSEEKAFSMAAAITNTWSEYLLQTTSDNIWPETAVGEKIEWPSTVTANFITAPTAEELVEKMINDEGLMLAFLPIDNIANIDGLSEAAIFHQAGDFLTSSQVAERGDLYNMPPSIIPKSSTDDFYSFHTNIKSGDHWPLFLVEYLYIRTDVVMQKLGPEQRGLLVALIQSIYERPLYIDQCYNRGFGHEVNVLLKTLSKHSIDLAFTEWVPLEPFTYESGDEVSSNKYVLTEQRRGSLKQDEVQNLQETIEEARIIQTENSADPEVMFDKDALTLANEQIAVLESMVKDLTDEIEAYENKHTVSTNVPVPIDPSKPGSTQPGIKTVAPTSSPKPTHTNNDDVPLNYDSESDRIIYFSYKDKRHIHTALVLGSIAFGFWTFSILGRTWWHCIKEIH